MVSPFLQIDYGEPIFANKNKYAIMVFVDLPNVNIWLKLGIEPRSPGSHPISLTITSPTHKAPFNHLHFLYQTFFLRYTQL